MVIAASDIAVWVITSSGQRLSQRLGHKWPDAAILVSRRLAPQTSDGHAGGFTSLHQAVQENFHCFQGHIFIMATGIVVRIIAPLLRHKTVDPAVVVVDDQGRFAISLIAGHIGGANELAYQVADQIGAMPVITTATDIHQKPAMDLLAIQLGLKIENPAAIKTVNMALLSDEKLTLYDPQGQLGGRLNPYICQGPETLPETWSGPGVFVSDQCEKLPQTILVLRPSTLCVGIGCNRNTPVEEIAALIQTVFKVHGLALQSIHTLATIDVKVDEPGLFALSEKLKAPLSFFSSETLNQVCNVPNPSAMATKHVGARSVCEAAAILAAHPGTLIIPKHKTRNVTVAVARRHFTSSVSVPEV